MLRALRHWITARTTDAAILAAPSFSPRALDRLGVLLERAGPHCPVVARHVAENMRALGLYTPEVHRAYFARLGDHFAGALHALRCAGSTQAGPRSEFAQLLAQRIQLHDSVARLSAATATGRGAILVGPHISSYLLNLARLNQKVPLTVYLRYSKDAGRRAAKQRWYQASGVGWISEAADAGGALGRLGRMAAALRAGQVLFITPDLPQKRAEGTPVRFFDREIYLPAGPAVLAERTGAPLFMLTARWVGAVQQLVVEGPCDVAAAAHGRAARQAAVHARLQWFTAGFERFVRAAAPLWYLWGDKRWTRLLHGDERYSRSLADASSATPPPSRIAGVA